MKLKKLPIGQSSFERIIKDNELYVDKTRIIYKLINSTKFNFLSRPRRFGKSLLVSTLKNVFLGNRERCLTGDLSHFSIHHQAAFK